VFGSTVFSRRKILSTEILDKLESQGEKILSGHKDIELVNEEVNLIWSLPVDDLSRPKRAVIIQHLRNNRTLFNTVKSARKAKKTKVPVPEGGIDLKDLDLDLEL
jgi:hypothetical protein